jgi:hypothetical protein
VINPETTETRLSPAPLRVPGVASIAIHGLLTGSGIEGTVLGTSSHAVWVQAGGDVIVISIGRGTRLPNGVHLPETAGRELLRRVHQGSKVLIGHGRITIGNVSVTVPRWWDPRPALPAVTAEDLAARLVGLPSEVPGINTTSLGLALEVGSAGGILLSAKTLLGKGPGLTPEGDDLLTGALGATRILGEATGRERAVALIAGISRPLAEMAEVRTTAYSAALLEMALRGRLVEPAGALLRALAGRGDIAASHLSLIRLGHTSGPALAAGIVLGAQALIQ